MPELLSGFQHNQVVFYLLFFHIYNWSRYNSCYSNTPPTQASQNMLAPCRYVTKC